MRKLSGREWQQFSVALREAFPDWNALQRMVRFQLDWNLANITSQFYGMEDVVYELIQYSESHNRTGQLIQAALVARPEDEGLAQFAESIGATVQAPSYEALEKRLSEANIEFDVMAFRQTMLEIEHRVCRVDIKNFGSGTGFLLGPDLVMTNYHVVVDVIKRAPGRSPRDVSLLFDYKRLADGQTLNPGKRYTLADEWLVDYSPYSPVDMQPEPKQGMPALDQLDYALLRVAGRPGAEPISYGDEAAGPGAPRRGWLELPSNPAYDFATNKVMFIVQHPRADPMKLTVNTFRSFNTNRTRLTYLNDTEGGSSGSPCFNGNWELVALHHSGDPAFRPSFNEGIPFAAIMSLLEKRGHLGKLGAPLR